MNYEIYSEKSNVIPLKDYIVIRNKIMANKENKMSRQGRQRKLYFNDDINYLVDVSDRDSVNTDRYSINVYGNDPEHMMVDKLSHREGTIYRQHTYITKAQCDQILQGDIAWMKESSCVVLRDLYWQMTINGSKPGVLVDYTREMYRLGYSGDFLIFDRAIASAYDLDFENMNAMKLALGYFPLKERLEAEKVVVTYRQGLIMPRVMATVLELGQRYRIAGQ